jgi:hypothetical protein
MSFTNNNSKIFNETKFNESQIGQIELCIQIL